MNECEKNRQIALRFLKETGLFSAWQRYIKSSDGVNQHNWYKVKTIDDIFGFQRFTYYLEKEGFFRNLKTTITTIFSTYVKKTHPEIESRKHLVIDYQLVLKIDKLTGNVEIIDLK